MKPEGEFLLKSLNPNRRCGQDYSKMDWNRFFEIAEAQLVASLLFPIVGKKAPKKMREKLCKAHTRQIAKNILKLEELKSLQAALAGESIEPVLLKGFAAGSNYKNGFARHATDIDLLFHKKDAEKIERVLFELGWSSELLYPKTKREFMKDWYHLPEFKKGLNFLEMHWKLSPNIGTIDSAALWKKSGKTIIGGIETKTLSLEHQLLHACIHLCLNEGFYRGTKNLLDIAWLSKNKGLDWGKVAAESRKWRTSFVTYACLKLCIDVWNSRIPNCAMQKLGQGCSTGQKRLAESVGADNLFSSIEEAMLWKNKFRLSQAEGFSKILVLASIFFPSKTRLSVKYGVPLHKKKRIYALAIANPFISAVQAIRLFSGR